MFTHGCFLCVWNVMWVKKKTHAQLDKVWFDFILTFYTLTSHYIKTTDRWNKYNDAFAAVFLLGTEVPDIPKDASWHKLSTHLRLVLCSGSKEAWVPSQLTGQWPGHTPERSPVLHKAVIESTFTPVDHVESPLTSHPWFLNCGRKPG